MPEARPDAAHRIRGQVTSPSSGGGLRGKPRGPNSDPLRASRVREISRKHGRLDPSLILSELPADVVTTLHVLLEIEVSRREGLMPKATPNLDVIGVTPDDAVLK